ncbi:MAG TPA: hypothetical protein VFF03_13495 [Rhodocyclaceae bacterium]|nr:hypothetical protein [Rhodocyclaceae bacterium]
MQTDSLRCRVRSQNVVASDWCADYDPPDAYGFQSAHLKTIYEANTWQSCAKIVGAMNDVVRDKVLVLSPAVETLRAKSHGVAR